MNNLEGLVFLNFINMIHAPEIMGKLINLKTEGYVSKEIKKQIYNGIKKGCREGFVHNNKMRVIGEWSTNLLIN